MTSRERLLKVLAGEVPDRVPVAPDFSNMIPARMTGKPFWDLYLYNDPPIWEAYIAAARHFDIDSLMDGFFPLAFPDEAPPGPPRESFIVQRDERRIVVQDSCADGGKRVWADKVRVYRVADPPATVEPARIALPPVPQRFEPVEGVRPVDRSPAGLKRVMALLGDQGLLGVFLASTVVLASEHDVYRYHDHPGDRERLAEERVEAVERRFARIMAMDPRPDFLCVGGSGTLIFQTPEIFRRLALPAVKRAIELATAAGFPTQVHSCGPERRLVEIFAEETDLTVIDPLEPPPMGDCDLGEIKRLYGQKIVLKGNLHTTDVMLRGSAADVAAASRQAIDAAAGGGRFILSAIATQLQKSLEIRDTTASTKYPVANPHQGKFRSEVSRYLSNSSYTGNSEKAWYLLADPNDLPVIEVAFLNGQESPTIETAEADFNVLGVQMRGYHDFGVNLQDPSGTRLEIPFAWHRGAVTGVG